MPVFSLKNIWWKDKSEEHTSELQSPCNLVCRLLLEKTTVLVVSHNPSVYATSTSAGVSETPPSRYFDSRSIPITGPLFFLKTGRQRASTLFPTTGLSR